MLLSHCYDVLVRSTGAQGVTVYLIKYIIGLAHQHHDAGALAQQVKLRSDEMN